VLRFDFAIHARDGTPIGAARCIALAAHPAP
jgi:hypothetical protein